MESSKDDVSAMVDRFMVLGARWCLDNVQVAALLGVDVRLEVMFDEGDVVWAVQRSGVDAERRMRLLNQVDGLLVRLIPDTHEVARWLRDKSVGYLDDMVTPLVAMADGGAPAIRALRNFLQELPDGGRTAL